MLALLAATCHLGFRIALPFVSRAHPDHIQTACGSDACQIRDRCQIAARSPSDRCQIAARSLPDRCQIAVRSLSDRCQIAVRSPPGARQRCFGRNQTTARMRTDGPPSATAASPPMPGIAMSFSSNPIPPFPALSRSLRGVSILLSRRADGWRTLRWPRLTPAPRLTHLRVPPPLEIDVSCLRQQRAHVVHQHILTFEKSTWLHLGGRRPHRRLLRRVASARCEGASRASTSGWGRGRRGAA